MSTSSITGSIKKPGNLFWILVGIGMLTVLLAAGWRVATGAELEAKGSEWSIKVTEAANSLDEARAQLQGEATRLKAEAAAREKYWTDQLAAAKSQCPQVAQATSPPPVSPSASAIAHSERVLADVARTTANARSAAAEIGRFRVPKF